MDEKEIMAPKDVVERNIVMAGEIMRYLLGQPQVFNALPDDFELIILPDDDPDMRLYNMGLSMMIRICGYTIWGCWKRIPVMEKPLSLHGLNPVASVFQMIRWRCMCPLRLDSRRYSSL